MIYEKAERNDRNRFIRDYKITKSDYTMRKDIQVNTLIGDVMLADNEVLTKRSFAWDSEGDVWLFGQVTLPSNYDVSKLVTEGVRVSIPYTPIYKTMKMRFVRKYGDSHERAVINPVDGGEWFVVKAKYYGNGSTTPKASELLKIGMDDYILQIDTANGIAYIWSGIHSDFVNINANIQNRNLLLRCVPSNNYRYPTSGVGLIRYLHSNLSRTGLADKLQSEFEADLVTVNYAAFNSDTGDLELDLDFTKADASV